MKIILVGGGGHCISSIEIIRQYPEIKIAGIVDLEHPQNAVLSDITYLGDDTKLETLTDIADHAFVTLGFIKSPAVRIRIFTQLLAAGFTIPVLKSKNSYISGLSTIGPGTIVMNKAVVNADVSIGKNTIINTGSIIEHGCLIGDDVHISTGAIVNGDCSVGNRVFIGSNSTIHQGVKIAEDIIVGAGSVVAKDLDAPGTYMGNPLRLVG